MKVSSNLESWQANGLESVITWYFSLPSAQRKRVDKMLRDMCRTFGLLHVVALQEIYCLTMNKNR